MQLLMSHIRAAMQKYDMIQSGDKIAIGVSGGKDSVALLYAMSQLRNFYPIPFDIVAISVDMNINNIPTDFSPITELCNSLNVKHTIRNTELWEIIFNIRKESNPCSLCAKMRRGILHDMTVAEGCNKIALGHHLDDVVETFYMNILQCGKIGCFSPSTYLSRRQITMIRPMIFCDESEVAGAIKRLNLPVVKSLCPADGNTQRESTKQLVKQFEKNYGSIREKTVGALERAEIDGWHT